ncbi:uncharacterized protein TNCV_4222791 [Trichonephila clavipes]|nr:uncharacterized protein TNCV_4222791 [Trichonephila clavipes]
MDAYKKATAEKYQFLLVDCFPTTDEEQRLRQSIFPDQKVPQDLVSEYYELNKPEIRVEDNISKILNEEETPDDMKAKLLSHWIPKYQRLMQPPPPEAI